jgi:hypothetical protein
VTGRFVSAANEAAADRSTVRIFIACDLDFASGHVRAHDGLGVLTWGSNDYDGVGRFGGIELAEETIDVIAKAVRMSLSGVDSSLMTTAMTEEYQGRQAILYFGLVDHQTNQLIDTPEILWEGLMDQMGVKLAQGTGAISLSCEHRLRREPRIARYTDADQQLAYPTDRFFDLLGKIQGFRGTWGATGVANDGGTSPSGHWVNHGKAGRWWVAD